MEEMKFSVLMSVYAKERANNLKLAMESIINQTLKPNEIVLVEDGKLTAELEEIVQLYEKSYDFVKVLRLSQNVGLGKALDEGLKWCKYEYIARMDSDDISVKKRFEKQIRFLKKNSNYSVVGGNIIEFDDNTNKNISFRKVPSLHNEILKYAQKRNPMNHVTVIFKKSDVIDAGGYKDCPFFEDYYLWIRMLKKDRKMYNIQEPLVRVRAGASMSNRRGNFKYVFSILNFEGILLKMKVINIFQYVFNVSLRVFIALLPNKIRYYFYQKRLRELS